MHYKYNVAQASHPFVGAPSCILNSVQMLQWAAGYAHQITSNGSPPADFNELLAVGYFQSMKMGVSNLR